MINRRINSLLCQNNDQLYYILGAHAGGGSTPSKVDRWGQSWGMNSKPSQTLLNHTIS